MEPTDHGVYLLDARGSLRLFDRVDHAAMAARGQHDKAAAFQVKRRGDLVSELIRDDRLRPLVLRQLVGVAADAVIHADLHCAWRQQLLKAVQSDLAGGEAMIGDKRRSLGEGHREIGIFQRLTVERAEIPLHRPRRPLTRAEAILTTDIEGQLDLQRPLVLTQKAGKSAEMIIMSVAQYESVELGWVDAQQISVVDERFRREAEVHENVSCLRPSPGFNVHRETEFTDQCLARRFIAADTPAEVLDLDHVGLSAGSDRELVAVRHHPDRQAIDLGHRSRDRRRPHGLRAAEQGRDHCAEHGGPATAEDVAPVHWKLFMTMVNGHDIYLHYVAFAAAKTAHT